MNGASVVLEAPAKLTLSLRVTGLRPDGFHLIDAEMVTLELADSLTVDTSRTGIEIVGAFAGDLAADLEDDLAGDSKLSENNLVARALKLVNRTARVVITKNIPSGGGLGGGSADA
ncbi:MAG: 4-(cytidine 5'-diphospho)-2-C-methyl-D-erythritol kinase, partial [Actinomycetota bacterium]